MKYKSYKELNSSSIEEWAKELDCEQKRELTTEETELFLEAALVEKYVENSLDFEEKIKGWNGVNLLHKRLSVHDFTMSKASQLCCGMMIASPGEMVMMANYIQYRCHLHKIKHVDMRALSEKIMPMGWFDKETLSKFWDKQKYESESGHLLNMLDNPEFGLSIMKLEG
jgi:hypothetical protein